MKKIKQVILAGLFPSASLKMKKKLIILFIVGILPLLGVAQVVPTWQNLINITQTADTLEKTSGGSAFNACANSANILIGNGWVKYHVISTGTVRLFGFSQNLTSVTSDAQVLYSFYTNGGSLLIREAGTQVNPSPSVSYTTGDDLLIERTGDTIYYKKNGSLIRKIATNSSLELNAAVVLHTVNSKFEHITTSFGIPLSTTGVIGNDVGGHQTGSIDVTTTGGTPPYTYLWSPGGQTTQDLTNQYPGTYTLTVTDSLSDTYVKSYTIAYGAEWENLVNTTLTGTTLEKTSGVNDWNAHANSTNILIGDGWVKYKVASTGGVLRLFGFSQHETSIVNDAQALYSFYTNGGSLYMREAGTQINPSPGLTYTTGDELLIERTGDTIYYKKNGTLVRKIATNASMELNAAVVVYTLNAKFEDITTSFGIPLSTTAEIGNDIGGHQAGSINVTTVGGKIPYTYLWSPGGQTTEDLTSLSPGTYTLTVTDSISDTYVKNFTVEYGAEWENLINITVTGTALEKTSGMTGFNAAANSTNVLIGDGWVKYKVASYDASSNALMRSFGFSQYQTSVTSDTQALYTFYTNGGSLLIREAGTQFNPSPWLGFAIGDELVVERTGDTIYYKKNGSLIRKVATTSSWGLNAVAVISSLNAKFEEITTSFGQLIAPTISSSITNNTCLTTNSGAIDLTVTGTDTPYTYSWTGPSAFADTTEDVSGLINGTYSVTVTGNFGSSAMETFNVVTAPLPVASFTNNINALPPIVEWSKNYGGSNSDNGYYIINTSDGGYIFCGESYSNDGDVSGNYGQDDYWVVKLDVQGNIQWQKNIGGSNYDWALTILQDTDGGYTVTGATYSNDGDFTGQHGGGDIGIVKLNASGTILWSKTIGGNDWDYPYRTKKTSDGGYIIAGYTASNDTNIVGNHGDIDGLIIKLDSVGTIQWQKCFGDSAYDGLSDILETASGDFVATGVITLNDVDDQDLWAIKISSTGTLIWQKVYGGTGHEETRGITAPTSGGYIITGSSVSTDGDPGMTIGNGNIWTIKLDDSGDIIWKNISGGNGNYEITEPITSDIDGGCTMAGTTNSTNNGLSASGKDGLLIKLNQNGQTEWLKNYGSSFDEGFGSLQKTAEGGYISTSTFHSGSGEVMTGKGQDDALVMKLRAPTRAIAGDTVVFTNTSINASSYQWKVNNTNVATTSNLSYTFSTAGTYTISLIATDSASCVDSSSLCVIIDPVLTVTVSPSSDTICINDSTTLTASGALTYSWNPSTGLSATTGAIVIAKPTTTTSYSVTGTGANGGTVISTVVITVPCIIISINTTGLDSLFLPDTITYTINGVASSGAYSVGGVVSLSDTLPPPGDSTAITISFSGGSNYDATDVLVYLYSDGSFSHPLVGSIGSSPGNMCSSNACAVGNLSNGNLFISPCAVSSCFPATLPYAILKRKLDGGYYKTINGTLYFKYEEEYNDGTFKFQIFDDTRTVVLSDITYPLPAFNKKYGDNRYEMGLNRCGADLPTGFYTLEVTNPKNEVFLLRFYNQDPTWSQVCGGGN